MSKIDSKQFTVPEPKQFTVPERGPICFPGLEVYDASALRAFSRCPFAYHMRYNKRLESELAAAAPLVFGGAVHAALAVLFSHEWDLELALKAYRDYPEIATAADKHRTPEKGEALIAAYRDRWAQSSDFKIIVNDGLMIETAFILPVTLDPNEPAVTVAGRIDCGISYCEVEYVMDHKTTSSMYYASNGLRPDLQFDIYSWAFRTLQGHCGGVIVDLMDIGKKGGFEFARIISPRSMWEMDQVPIQVLAYARHIRLCKALEIWPTFRTHCFMYGRQCDYVNCCIHNVEIGLRQVREGGEE